MTLRGGLVSKAPREMFGFWSEDRAKLSQTEEDTDDTQSNLRTKFPKPFAGIAHDLRDRLPVYWSDWSDSWDYRVIPSVIETFFNNLLPAIAFAQDMFDRTDHSYGVNEVLLASTVGGVVFGLLAGQPLCIVGVTGPITIFNYTVYEVIKPLHTNYFGFMFWVCIWSMIFHFLLAIFNAVCLLQYVTTFPCDVFGLFNNVVYMEKGIQILVRQFKKNGKVDLSAGFASTVVALLMTMFGLSSKLITKTPFFSHRIRTFIADYSTALSVVFWSGFIHFGGFLSDIDFQKLPITKSFIPTSHLRDRTTWLAYEAISTRDIFIALPFGLVLTTLFYFDHNVSSLMAQRYQYRLKKASTFHYDFALLGATTGVSGILGIPAPNGLIPQAPLHTESLLVRDKRGEVVRCVEQRFTNTAQGLLTLATMSRPLLVCLGQIPQAVLSGLFFIMGLNNLLHNAILGRIMLLITERDKRDLRNLIYKVPLPKVLIFLSLSLAGFAAEFAISNTIAAIGFPLILLLTVIVSLFFPKWFSPEDLKILDEGVAEEFTLKNLQVSSLTGTSAT
ncbi:Bor1p [Lachancea thermotolerans CBS 6340]|uniref:KLTH0F02156p n=1 Tax=Lachancea thermotolerans (strain ATCC 56472 / CBS 6340 / NRRL Y-8284) TaxID=559295 RepID=C5DK66_LACTC|nr:KLTH0F02156p [Lachancea thermotolerans CBS 6340]CAR23867.1 KLTH0F02156p [Lachancea thermotolerans CBS 6340]